MSSRNAAFHDGALAGVLLSPLKLVFSLALGLAALLLCAWILDWTFVFKVWPQGIERLRELLAHDLEQGVALAAQQGAGAGAITAPANALYSFVFEATGVHDILTKSMGSANVLNVVSATMDALDQLKDPKVLAAIRGKDVRHVMPFWERKAND